jgi:glycosyltransferase involved in cell wall biosynthesis
MIGERSTAEERAGVPVISVCIVTRGRSRLLDACLASLHEQVDAPPWELRVLADGDATVATMVRERFPHSAVGVFRDALPGGARNLVVDGAAGDLLLFLDDDVIVEPNLLRRLADLAQAHPEVSVFGGPNVTPPRSTMFQTVQGAVLGSLIGAGPVRRRYGRHPLGSADERWFTLCNLAVRRAAMPPFSEKLVCAEENEVLDRLSSEGHQMLYDPSLVAFHERRPTFRGFVSQMRKYGRGRGQLIGRRPSSVRPAFLLPSGLLVYLALLPLALIVLGPVAALPLAVYGAAVLAQSVKVAFSVGRLRSAPLAAALIVTLHACYGLGLLWGVLGRTVTGSRGGVRWTPAPDDSPAEPSG